MTEHGAALTRTLADNVEVGRLFEFLTALGQHVRITMTPTKKRQGEMEVVVG
jgi:asparagine N-glycosylation enzyme membrane subunit Stt3